MVYLFSFYFSTLELKKLASGRLSFKTQLKSEILWPYSGHEKCLEISLLGILNEELPSIKS